MRFADPWVLLLLLLLPLLVLLRRRRQAAAVTFSDTGLAQLAGSSWRSRLAGLPFGLRLLALGLLILALARPQLGTEKIHHTSHGIAIMMVVDRSSSMGAAMALGGRKQNRLATVKDLFAAFVQGDGKKLGGRPDDLIGMVAFARYAETICPLTLAHDALTDFLATIHLVQRREEDGTAIGDALALAAARLQKVDQQLAREDRNKKGAYTIKSKCIILLTDGENNMGRQTPRQAAELAKKWGIKIYAIGVGGDDTMTIQTFFGTQTVKTGRGVDMATLSELARITGGQAWQAKDDQALAAIYRQIDQLEKSEVESTRYIDYRERFAPLVWLAMLLLVADRILAGTLFRRLP